MSIATPQSVVRRKGLFRTVFFSLVSSIIFPVTMNIIDPISPRDEYGSPLLWLGGFSSTFVISSLMMLLVAVCVAVAVERGVLERGEKQGVLMMPIWMRMIMSWVLILLFGTMASISL